MPTTINLTAEIQRLETELATIKSTSLWKIERRVNELLEFLDEPASPKTNAYVLREKLITILATAILTASIVRSPTVPQIFQPKVSVEHVSSSPTTPAATPISTLVTPSATRSSTEISLERLMRAISTQESGGDHTRTNPDSGASGRFQIMPDNIPSWSKEALGYSLSHAQFMSSPELQVKIARYKFNQYLSTSSAPGRSQEEIIRRVAATWYSGRPSLWNNTRPQYSNGRRYPSIAEYTASVWQLYKGTSVLDKTRQIISSWSEQFQKDAEIGDVLAGYPVTYGRGPRVFQGQAEFHQGVDIALPIGTPLHAISKGKVRCSFQDGGGGNIATFTSPEFPGLDFQFLHLSKCVDIQELAEGGIIGYTGNTGRSTGPHLHLQIKSQSSGNTLRVRRGWLHWFLTGAKP